MSEITILDKMPVIFTKDAQFLKDVRKLKATAGGIILLPEDAVLVIPLTPTNTNPTAVAESKKEE